MLNKLKINIMTKSEKLNQNLGIDKIVSLIIFINSLGLSLLDKLSDKKFTWSERVSLIIELKPILEILHDWRELKNQILDLQINESQELIAIIQNEIDLPQEKVKLLINNILNLVSNLIELIENIQQLKK